MRVVVKTTVFNGSFVTIFCLFILSISKDLQDRTGQQQGVCATIIQIVKVTVYETWTMTVAVVHIAMVVLLEFVHFCLSDIVCDRDTQSWLG